MPFYTLVPNWGRTPVLDVILHGRSEQAFAIHHGGGPFAAPGLMSDPLADNVLFEEWATVAMAYLGPIDETLEKEPGPLLVYVLDNTNLFFNAFRLGKAGPPADPVQVQFFQQYALPVYSALISPTFTEADLFAPQDGNPNTYALIPVQMLWICWIAGHIAGKPSPP